jgi:hypothetical protein
VLLVLLVIKVVQVWLDQLGQLAVQVLLDQQEPQVQEPQVVKDPQAVRDQQDPQVLQVQVPQVL